MARLLSDNTVRERILLEGLDHAILHYYGPTPKFANPKLVAAWGKAHAALIPLLRMLDLKEDY